MAALESTKKAAFSYMKIKERILGAGSVLIGTALGGIIYDGLQRPLTEQQARIEALQGQLDRFTKGNGIIHDAFVDEMVWQNQFDCAVVQDFGFPVDCTNVDKEEMERWRNVIREAVENQKKFVPEPTPMPGDRS